MNCAGLVLLGAEPLGDENPLPHVRGRKRDEEAPKQTQTRGGARSVSKLKPRQMPAKVPPQARSVWPEMVVYIVQLCGSPSDARLAAVPAARPLPRRKGSSGWQKSETSMDVCCPCVPGAPVSNEGGKR